MTEAKHEYAHHLHKDHQADTIQDAEAQLRVIARDQARDLERLKYEQGEMLADNRSLRKKLDRATDKADQAESLKCLVIILLAACRTVRDGWEHNLSEAMAVVNEAIGTTEAEHPEL